MTAWALAVLALLPQEPVERLFERLDSDSVAERDRADAELRRRIREAVASLEAGLGKSAPESRRARAALETLAGGKVLPRGILHAARVSLPDRERPLDETLKDLAAQSRIPIVRDSGPAAPDVVLPATPFKDAPLDAVLDALGRKSGGFWLIEGERVRFLAGGKVVLRLFDVSGLTTGWQDEPWLPILPDEEPPKVPEDVRQSLTGEDVANLVKHAVAPKQWEEAEGKSIQFQNGLLIVRNDPGVLDQVDRYLDGLREKHQAGVIVEVQAYRCRPDVRPGEDPFEELRKLSDEGKAARRIAAFHRVPLDKRRIALASETTAHLVTRYDGNGNPMFEPLAVGARVNVRASLTADGGRVRVTLDARLSRLVSVEKRKTERGQIQFPTVESHRLHSDETVEAGKGVVLGRVQGPAAEGPLTDFLLIGRFERARPR